jgi:hypothetical protein
LCNDSNIGHIHLHGKRSTLLIKLWGITTNEEIILFENRKCVVQKNYKFLNGKLLKWARPSLGDSIMNITT